VAFRCVECGRWFHRNCIRKHFEAHRLSQREWMSLTVHRLATAVTRRLPNPVRPLTNPFVLSSQFAGTTAVMLREFDRSFDRMIEPLRSSSDSHWGHRGPERGLMGVRCRKCRRAGDSGTPWAIGFRPKRFLPGVATRLEPIIVGGNLESSLGCHSSRRLQRLIPNLEVVALTTVRFIRHMDGSSRVGWASRISQFVLPSQMPFVGSLLCTSRFQSPVKRKGFCAP
jgi:hypothetical protein